MTCLFFRSSSLHSGACSKIQIPGRIPDVNTSRVRTGGIYCYSKGGNKPGRRAERNVEVEGGGFASLAALLQQQQNKKASKKVTKVGSGTTTGKSLVEQPRGKENKVALRENSQSSSLESVPVPAEGRLAVADTTSEEAPNQNFQPLTKEEEAFSAAVLAGLKDSASLERQRKLRRRNNTRKGKRPSEWSGTEEKRLSQVEDVKPIIVNPEWRASIQALERKLSYLKQEYYNRV